jgi:hypothetical protein
MSEGNGKAHPAIAGLSESLPPQNLEAERYVLCALLIDNSYFPEVIKILSPDHFYRDNHQLCYRAMLAIHARGQPVDGITLADELIRRDQFAKLGGDEFLYELSLGAPHAVNCPYHAALIVQKAKARDLAEASTLTLREVYSGLWTADQLAERASARLAQIDLGKIAHHRLSDGRINWSVLSDEDMGMRLASTIKPRRIEWLMPDRIPNLAYTLIAGEGKQGKSQFTMALGALFSVGGEWWDGSGAAVRGHVLYLSAEDDAERAIRPRLEALGADLDMITVLEARYKIPSDDAKEPLISFAELGDLVYWREVFSRVKDPLVIFVDPIPSYIGRGVNDRKNSEVRAVLGPFIALAVEFGLTVIGITHLGKSIDPTKSLTNRVLDSIAYTNLARAVHFVARDPADHDRKFFMPGPCNYAPAGLESLAFKLVEKEVRTELGDVIIVAVAEFEPSTVAVDAQDVVSVVGKKKPGPQSKVRMELAEWLYERLKDSPPVPAFIIYDEAGEAFAHKKPNPLGVKEDKFWTGGRSLTRAADIDLPELPYPMNGKRVEKYRDPDNNRWYWRLVDNRFELGADQAAF